MILKFTNIKTIFGLRDPHFLLTKQLHLSHFLLYQLSLAWPQKQPKLNGKLIMCSIDLLFPFYKTKSRGHHVHVFLKVIRVVWNRF